MGRKRGDSLDDAVIVLGLAVVGYLAYREYYPGQPINSVLRDIESQIASFIKSGIAELGSLVPPLSSIVPPQPTPSAPASSPPAAVPAPASVITPPPSSSSQIPPTTEEGRPATREETGQLPINPKTTPRAGSGSAGNYSIIGVAGDFDVNSKAEGTVAAMQKAGVQFMVGTGDYGYDNSASSWGSMLSPYKGRMKGAIGNHDGDEYLPILGQSKWNFNHKISSDLSVVFISTESGISASELDSLTSAAKSQSTHVMYAQHMPYVTSSDGHHKGSENKSGSVIDAAAKKHGVKLVVSGHNHCYEHAMQNGIHYVTSGAAGRKFYSTGCKITGAVKCINNTNGFLKITVGPNLLCQFLNNNGQILDTFTIGATAKQTAALVQKIMIMTTHNKIGRQQ